MLNETEDTVSGREPGYGTADRRNFAGDFQPGDVAPVDSGWRGIGSLPLHAVGAVDAGGPDPDEEIVGTLHRRRTIDELQDLV